MKKSLIKESVLFITGRRENVKVEGPKNQIEAYLDVLIASRDLYEALNQKDITLKEVNILVERKKELAKAYTLKTTKDWLL
jgi:hypothetical protein